MPCYYTLDTYIQWMFCYILQVANEEERVHANCMTVFELGEKKNPEIALFP